MFKFTHFPKVIDKATSHQASQGQKVSFKTFKDAFEFISTNAISPSTFNQDKRSKEGFEETSIFMLDIDSGVTIEQAKERLAKLNLGYGIYTSVSHQIEKNGMICDRYRIVLELDRVIKSHESFRETAKSISKIFPESDRACLEPARYFLGNKNGKTIFTGGHKAQVVEVKQWVSTLNKLQASKEAKHQLTSFFKGIHTGYPGSWNNELNRAAYTAARCGLTQVDFLKIVTDAAPNLLDDGDLKTIKSGHSSGAKAGPYKDKDEGAKANKGEIIESYILGLEIQKTTKGLFIKGERFDMDDLINYAYCELIKGGSKVKIGDVGAILKNWYRTVKDDTSYEQDYFKDIKFDARIKKTKEIDRAVSAISAENHELNRVALMHWIWQVKRKIFGKQVFNHLMLVLYGKSGSGKTIFLNKFLEVLKPFVLPADVSLVNDSREFHNLSENFVIFFDEMAHAARADVNKLKNIITCDTISFRLLGKNSNVEHKNNSSFIGASNTEIIDLIKDPTSARRYFQMNTLDKLDWNVINTLDYKRMFQEVDEEEESPMFSHLAEIAEFQEREIRSRDSIEEWLEVEDIHFCTSKEEEGREVSPNDLYGMYSDDQISQGKRMYHRKSYFFKRLKTLATQFRHHDKRFYKLRWKKDGVSSGFINVLEVEEKGEGNESKIRN